MLWGWARVCINYNSKFKKILKMITSQRSCCEVTLTQASVTWRDASNTRTRARSPMSKLWHSCINKSARSSRSLLAWSYGNYFNQCRNKDVAGNHHEQSLLTCINELHKNSSPPSCFMNVSLTHARVDEAALMRAKLWMGRGRRRAPARLSRSDSAMHIAITCLTTEGLPYNSRLLSFIAQTFDPRPFMLTSEFKWILRSFVRHMVFFPDLNCEEHLNVPFI